MMHLLSFFFYVSILLNLAIAVNSKGFSMKMIRSDSKESPLYARYANLTQGERFQSLVQQSKARAHYFASARAAAYNKTSSTNPDIVRPPVRLYEQRSYYIAQVGIGIFPDEAQHFRNYYLLMDTGSDLIWTQCRDGGVNYFYQDDPFYPQDSSTSYRRIPCQFLNECDDNHCQDGFCTYQEGYASGIVVSRGHLAYETFTINSNTREHPLEDVVDVIMGCGLDQQNFGPMLGVPETHDGDHRFPEPLPAPGTAPIAGILGLGQGFSQFSLARQLVDGNRFEYCLVSYELEGVGGAHTYLRFGSDAIIGGGPEVGRTPILQDQNFMTPYLLVLEDISVGDRRVGFDVLDFERVDGQGGVIIDSGSPYSVMYMPHFVRVRDLFVEHFQALGVQPLPPGHRIFDPCWVLPNDFNITNIPTMTFHFQDADFVIRHKSGIYAYQGNLLCLAIVGIDVEGVEDLIFGAMQQTNKRILYDVNEMVLSFKEDECTLG